jgi:sugar diacid utilization regulator
MDYFFKKSWMAEKQKKHKLFHWPCKLVLDISKKRDQIFLEGSNSVPEALILFCKTEHQPSGKIFIWSHDPHAQT